VVIISIHHHHLSSAWSIDIGHRHRGSSSSAVSLKIVIDIEFRRHPPLSLKTISESRFIVGRQLFPPRTSSFTSDDYPVGNAFEYFGSSLASL